MQHVVVARGRGAQPKEGLGRAADEGEAGRELEQEEVRPPPLLAAALAGGGGGGGGGVAGGGGVQPEQDAHRVGGGGEAEAEALREHGLGELAARDGAEHGLDRGAPLLLAQGELLGRPRERVRAR